MPKILAILLAAAMHCSLSLTAFAASPAYKDIDGHWAQKHIERWGDAGIVNGKTADTFDPNGKITRAETAQVFTKLMQLTRRADISGYVDVDLNAWYADAISKCVAAGILEGVSRNRMDPNGAITREAFFTMFCRAMGIDPERSTSARVSDSGDISSWASGYIYALANRGYISGVGNNEIRPSDPIDRASVMALLDKAIDSYVTEGGTVRATSDGIILIVTDEPVIITGSGDALVVIACDDAKVSLRGATGEITVNVEADDVTITDAPDGTLVNIGENTRGTTANGEKILVDTVIGKKPDTKPSTPTTPSKPEEPTTHIHNYSASWSCDETEHWHACQNAGCPAPKKDVGTHSWDEGKITIAATCEADGVKTYTCTVCGYEKTEAIAKTGHSYATEWSKNETKHWHECTVCGAKADEADHTWGDETVVPATAAADGSRTVTCTVCGYEKTETITMKLDLKVTSGSSVEMFVDSDYNALFTLPGKTDTVNTASVTLDAMMKDVSALGVSGTRHHTTTVNTGLGSNEVVLSGWLPNTYKFGGATINATIGGASCIYTLSAIDENNQIKATTDTEAARAAWQALTSHISTGTQAENNSYLLLKKGAELKIGTEYLHFAEKANDLTLDNLNNLGELEKTIRDAIELTTCDDQSGTITVKLAAGTKLAVGSSTATLNDDCTITITGDPDVVSEALGGCLSNLKAATNGTAIVKQLVELFDNVVAVAAYSGSISVNVSFN